LPISIESPLEQNGAVPVNIQDQTTEVIDLHLAMKIADITLDAAVAIDEYSAIISSDIAPVV
jgi:hypothetical protein